MATAFLNQINIKRSSPHEISVDEKPFDNERLDEITQVFSHLKTETLKGWYLQDRCFDEILKSCCSNEWEKLQTIREQILGIRNSRRETLFEVYARTEINFCLNLPENLVFQGGGPKGIAYIGAIKVLEERNILRNVKRVAGTSAGAITATLIALGYSSEEIYNFLVERPLTDFLDFAPSCRGICAGTEFLNWINQVIKAKTGIFNCTFGEIRQKIKKGENFKHLHVFSIRVGANKKAFHFSSDDDEWDNLIIGDAVFASMCLPIYPPHTLHFKDPKNQLRYPIEDYGSFMDGGLSGDLINLPIDAFDTKKYTDPNCLKNEHKLDEFNKRTLAFSLYDPYEDLPQEITRVTCFFEAFLQWGQSEKSASSIHKETKACNPLRTIRISNTRAGTILGFFEDEGKLSELIESGRAATLGFFQEQEEQLERIAKLEKPKEEIIFHKEERKAFYHTFKNDFSRGSMLAVEIVGDRISFHTDYITSGAPLANPIRDQFSFTKLAALDARFLIFEELRNAREEITDTPEKSLERTASLKRAEDLYKQHESFFRKCFHWDIFRQLIIERNIPEYLNFFLGKGFSFTTQTLHPLWYAYQSGAFKNFNSLLQSYKTLLPEQKFDLRIVEPKTHKTPLYYMAKEGQIDLAKAYCLAYKKRHPKSYQKLLDHKVNSTSGIKKSALDIALEKGKNRVLNFLIKERANYQHWYHFFYQSKYDGNSSFRSVLAGEIDRKLSSLEKFTALEFCLTQIYQRRCVDGSEGRDPVFDNDHTRGYQYAEDLIRNKIMHAPFNHIVDCNGNGLLLTVLKHTKSVLFRGRLTRLLLEGKYRDDVNQVNNQGVTPLIAAAKANNEGEFDFLEQRYRELSTKELKEADVMGCLLAIEGIDVNYQDLQGNTALHYAVSQKAHRKIEYLLSRKDINPNVRNNSGQTPLHLTQEPHIFKILTDCGAIDTMLTAQGITLREMHNYLKKPEYLSHIAHTIGGGYMRLHESRVDIGDKVVSGTFQTLFYTLAFPFLAVADICSSINHATTADGSVCTCASCIWKRKKGEIKLRYSN